jgi:hypothetical protein
MGEPKLISLLIVRGANDNSGRCQDCRKGKRAGWQAGRGVGGKEKNARHSRLVAGSSDSLP